MSVVCDAEAYNTAAAIEAKKPRKLSWFGETCLEASKRADLVRSGSRRFLSLFSIGKYHLLHFLRLFYIMLWLVIPYFV